MVFNSIYAIAHLGQVLIMSNQNNTFVIFMGQAQEDIHNDKRGIRIKIAV